MQSSSVSSSYTSPAYQQNTGPSTTLDKNGFLKLLSAQMQNQDPSSSQDPTQYFNTISQMSMVEQLTNLAQDSTEAAKAQKTASAEALLGRTVTYVGQNGLPTSGLVQSVDLTGTAPKLTVAGVAGIDPAGISEVQ